MIQTWINNMRRVVLDTPRSKGRVRSTPTSLGDLRLATGAEAASEASRFAFASLMQGHCKGTEAAGQFEMRFSLRSVRVMAMSGARVQKPMSGSRDRKPPAGPCYSRPQR
jgi:hypothetical protein